MILWTLTFVFLIFGFRELTPLWIKLKLFWGTSAHILALRRGIEQLKLLAQILESGMVPDEGDWALLKSIPKPWGALIHQSLSDLRAHGAPVLPTLSRMQSTLLAQIEQIQEAQVKSAQALGQAIIGFVMIPAASVALYFLLPGIEEAAQSFFALVIFALFLNSLSFIWMITLAEHARFANLRSEKRRFLVSVDATIDRLIALISTGLPPDLSWKRSVEELSVSDPGLANSWGHLVWENDLRAPALIQNDCERLMIGVGVEIKKSIQSSLIEGRACLDRIESIQKGYQSDLRMLISKELSLLPNRCLKPLFIFVLPSFMILLAGSFFLTLGSLIS